VAGRLIFTTGGANAQDTELNGGPRVTVTGRIDVQRGQGGTRHFRNPMTLAAGGQFNVEALASALLESGSGTHSIAGTLNVAGGGYLGVRGGSQTVTQTGGTIPGAGTVGFENTTTFVHQGGTVTGELQLLNGSALDPSGPGAAAYHWVGVANLVGDVNAAATITAEASGGQSAQVTMAAPRTIAGRVNFTTGGANAQDTELNGGGRVTVTGRIDAQLGQGGTRHFRNPLTLAAAGQFTVQANVNALLDGTSAQTHSLAGTLDVAAGGYLGVRSGPHTVTQTGGTISGAGGFGIENLNTFVHQGGTVTGDLQINNGGSLDPSGPGAAAYHVVGNAILAGDINAAATVTADSAAFTQAQLTLSAPRTVAGRLVLTTTGPNAQDAIINGPGRMTVTGRVDVQKGVGGIRHFTGPLTIAAGGQFNVGADATAWVNGNGNVLDHQLAGNVSVAAGATLLFRVGTQTITQTAGTITATGSFTVEGNTFVHQGGTAAGRLTMSSGGVRTQLDASGPGTMNYRIVNGVNLIADVSADARIDVGDDTVSGQIYVRDKDVTNKGTIQVGQENSQWAGQIADDGQPYTLTNQGSIAFGKGGQQVLNVRTINTGTLTLNGYVSGIASIENQPLVTNSGTVTVKDGFTTWRGYTQTGGLTDLVDGSIGSPRTVAPTTIDVKGGRLRGTGVLYGPVNNAGTIEVGRAGTYGKLAIKDVFDQIVRVAASYTQTPTGRLAVDVGGTAAGTTFDQLTVDGPATFDGALDVTTASGYTPTPNVDTYRVVQSETRTKEFANLTGGRFYTLSHDGTGALLTGRVAPPPSSELTIGDSHVLEGAGPLTFTVTLSKASADPVTVDWATEDDTAAAGTDYTASS
ncbi:MAG TPA: hypothetical protein VI300_25070, partial [Solirubrobacter sp.]